MVGISEIITLLKYR